MLVERRTLHKHVHMHVQACAHYTMNIAVFHVTSCLINVIYTILQQQRIVRLKCVSASKKYEYCSVSDLRR